MVETIKLRVADSGGNLWVVPAEMVPTKFRLHQFAVHKSITLDDDRWAVTHIDSSFVVAYGANKQESIDAAKAALSKVKAERFQSMIDDAMAKKPKITVGEAIRTIGIV